MFKCGVCGKTSEKGEPRRLKVIEQRRKTYPARRDKSGTVIDSGGQGWEIAKEITVCPRCIPTE